MQNVHLKLLRRFRTPTWAGFTVLAVVLAVLTGCATEGPVQPAPVVEKAAVSEAASASVARLQDGRQGIVITETAQLNDASRKDFESAVKLLNEEAYDKAIELLKKVIDQSPGVTAPFINLGMAYQRIGKPDQAEAQFKAALQLVPGHPVAGNQYGLLLRRKGRFNEARKIYEEALARFPDYYPLHRNLGILCDLYLNDLESAYAHYEIYILANPEDAQVKLWMADLGNRMGKN